MRVLVTGGTGFVGQHLVKRLVEEGHQVDCLVRTTSHIINVKSLGARVCYRMNHNEYSVVYHLAGALGKRGRPMYEYVAPAVELTRTLMRNMQPGQRFIYMSSQNIFLSNLKAYEKVKIVGEDTVCNLAETHDIDYRIIRPGFIYGIGDLHHKPLFELIERLGSFFPIIGSGKNMVCPTYIEDVINTVMMAYNTDEKVLPVAGRPVSLNDFLREIAKALGVNPPKYHFPALRIPLIQELMRVDFFTQTQRYTTAFDPTPLEIGLKESINWYSKKGGVKC